MIAEWAARLTFIFTSVVPYSASSCVVFPHCCCRGGSVHLFCLSVCWLAFNETWGNDSPRRRSVCWLARGGGGNYRSELWILISMRVAPTLDVFSCPYSADLPHHQRVFHRFKRSFFPFLLGLTQSGAASRVGALAGLVFIFASCLCIRRCALGVPGVACMFNSCRTSCINQPVSVRSALPHLLAARSWSRIRKCDQANQFDLRPASNQTSLWGCKAGAAVSHGCQSWTCWKIVGSWYLSRFCLKVAPTN